MTFLKRNHENKTKHKKYRKHAFYSLIALKTPRKPMFYKLFMLEQRNENTKIPPKKSTDSAKNIVSDLHTVGDFIRYGVSRSGESDLFFGHGTDNAFDEAVFIVLESLSLPVDTLEPYWHSRLTRGEKPALHGLLWIAFPRENQRPIS